MLSFFLRSFSVLLSFFCRSFVIILSLFGGALTGVAVEVKSYSGLGHSACPKEFEDLGKWLAKQIPAAELAK
jgi:hypothetical protein